METLLADIESFLVTQGMSATAFGEKALNHRHFVRQVREGRECLPKTVRKVRAFMQEYKPVQRCEVVTESSAR
jgi:hypothetical protein